MGNVDRSISSVRIVVTVSISAVRCAIQWIDREYLRQGESSDKFDPFNCVCSTSCTLPPQLLSAECFISSPSLRAQLHLLDASPYPVFLVSSYWPSLHLTYKTCLFDFSAIIVFFENLFAWLDCLISIRVVFCFLHLWVYSLSVACLLWNGCWEHGDRGGLFGKKIDTTGSAQHTM